MIKFFSYVTGCLSVMVPYRIQFIDPPEATNAFNVVYLHAINP